jgi:5-dehydro-2-deoxygluconokinase
MEADFGLAAAEPVVKGFAAGRTVFSKTARRWFADTIGDEAATAEMAERFQRCCRLWQRALALARLTREPTVVQSVGPQPGAS